MKALQGCKMAEMKDFAVYLSTYIGIIAQPDRHFFGAAIRVRGVRSRNDNCPEHHFRTFLGSNKRALVVHFLEIKC